MSTMTLEQVRDWHRQQAKNNLESELYHQAPTLCEAFADRHMKMADAIDAYLRERESAKAGVNDEVVGAAIHAYSRKTGHRVDRKGMRAALEAVASMLASARVPDGWQLVPKKMDANMLREFRRVAGAVIGMHAACMGYIAALAAAPKRGEG